MQILIVGLGISGTNIAAEALNRGIKVKVIDLPQENTPSKTAAGMFNPITFRLPTLTKDASKYFAVLNSFYSKLEQETGEKFYFPLPYTRIFSSPEEQNNWIHRCTRESFRKYASSHIQNYTAPISAPYGGAEVYEAGYVETEKMLKAYRKKLLNENLLIQEYFDHNNLGFDSYNVSYLSQKGSLKADYIIFAEGPQIIDNPLFQFLPFRPVKGEVLTIKIKDFEPRRIISKGMFLIPKGNQLFYAGATYSHDNLDTIPSVQAKQKILGKIEKLVDKPVEVVEHRAGIRPATKDRNPLIGKHPQHSRILLFNGMGSKAISTTPYLASELLNYLEYGTPVNPEVDLNRFAPEGTK